VISILDRDVIAVFDSLEAEPSPSLEERTAAALRIAIAAADINEVAAAAPDELEARLVALSRYLLAGIRGVHEGSETALRTSSRNSYDALEKEFGDIC
jgi:hypothetical protein